MRKTTQNIYLLADALRSGLVFATHSPGDGVTRYRFYVWNGKDRPDYFADDGLYTALGRAEAQVFIRGYNAGRTHGK